MGEIHTLPTAATVVIDPSTDRLVDTIEAGGLNFYALQSDLGATSLAFEFARRQTPTDEAAHDAITAARKLSQLVGEDAALRERVVDHALSMGALYRSV